jgi:multiple antibiotic resistance protein
MEEYLLTLLSLFVGLITVLNPLAAAPTWLTMTTDRDPRVVRIMAKKVGWNVFILLLIFLFFGRLLLEFYGITLTAIRLAGAVVIILTALRMILQRPKKLSDDQIEKSREQEDISFSPVAMPLLVGPGSMAVMLQYTEQFGYVWHSWQSASNYGLLLMVVAVVSLISYLVLHFSQYLLKVLGPGGIIGMSRIMAFMLLAIGMQSLINTLKEVIRFWTT